MFGARGCAKQNHIRVPLNMEQVVLPHVIASVIDKSFIIIMFYTSR